MPATEGQDLFGQETLLESIFLNDSTAVLAAPDKHSQYLERRAAATATPLPLTPVIHLTGFTFSEMRASLIPPLDRWEEMSNEKHLYKPEELAKAEAQAQTAIYLQLLIALPDHKGRPEFNSKLEEVIALCEVMKTREKHTWEKCYPVRKK